MSIQSLGKRGQIFLFAALLIGFMLFILMAETNIVKKAVIESDFQEISRNFEVEAQRFVNYLIASGNPDIESAFLNFSTIFTSYSKTKNPDFGLIYTFVYKNNLYIGNFLDVPVTFHALTTQTLQGCFDDVDAKISVAGLQLSVADIPPQINACSTTMPITATIPTEITIDIHGMQTPPYAAQLTRDMPEVIIVTIEEKGQERKIYSKGRFR